MNEMNEINAMKEMNEAIFHVFFFETFICLRGVFYLNCYIGKQVQKIFSMGLKIW